MTVTELRDALVGHIINPIMAALFVVAIIVFMWGIVEFIGSEATQKESGRKHIIWGIVGIFIMASAVTFLNLTFGTITSVFGR